MTFPGLTDFSSSPCPPGFWCSGTGPPIYCPAGTQRSLPGAASPSQCEPCTGGNFCPDPRAAGQPNVEGIPCRASFQCPRGITPSSYLHLSIHLFIIVPILYLKGLLKSIPGHIPGNFFLILSSRDQ